MIKYSEVREGRKCVIWTRVSTKYQEENGGSLQTQKEICKEYADRNGYQVLEYFGGKHESAATPGDMIKTMVRFVKRTPTVSTILVSEFDRFSRLAWQAIKMLHDMRALGIVVIATKIGLDTRTKEGMMWAQNSLSAAEWDNQNRTDKFVSGKEQCLRAGAWVLKAPLGYFKVGKSRTTECRLNDKGILIAKAFKWKLQGLPGVEILAKLKARGFPLTDKRLHWILTNPFYAGKIVSKATSGEMIDGNIEPAVSYANFLRVQEILSGRTGKYVQAKQKPDLPLTKHVFCALDGTAFTSYTKHKLAGGVPKEYGYYKCNHAGCGTNVPAKQMHERFERLLQRFNLNPEVLSRFESLLRNSMQSYSEQAQQEQTLLKKRMTETENAIQRLKVRLALGEIPSDVYEAGMQELQARKDTYTLEMEQWNVKISNCSQMIPKIIVTASNISSLWKSGNLEIKRRIQNLVFPEGILWDKGISDYRTPKTGGFFEIMGRFSDTYIKTKETSPCELVSLCGR